MRFLLLPLALILAACGDAVPTKKLSLQGPGSRTVVLSGVSDSAALKEAAKELGIEAVGESIVLLRGEVAALNQLRLEAQVEALEDEAIAQREKQGHVVEESHYLAKKDFGILELWKTNPRADGRGVTVGVFDDGISPHQPGLQVTTTGARKVLRLGSTSSFGVVELTESADDLVGTLDETREAFGGRVDFNADGKFTKLAVRVRGERVCLDLDGDDSFATHECRGSFSQTGEFFGLEKTNRVIVAELDREKKTVSFSQPESSGDSHGEGVAGAMAQHFPGQPRFDGVAPGAQIVDIDISERTDKAEEAYYTIGKVLVALEWLAKNGAEVANVSYSFFFTSVKAQDFMAKAIDALVKKYNIVLSFSAGNNGPALGSLNRRAMYPDSVLVAGAFVSRDLDERVWGVTGLPEEGRVVYYSSLGPGPLGEAGPLLISPLSSLTVGDPDSGARAFSGTSSASPALAGAAAVLISALKLEGLKIDAATVVHALRLSGQRLAGEPFVAQGYGLPQIPAAIEWYKRLSSGESFLHLNIRTNKNAQDGITGKGLVLRTSTHAAVESARLEFNGVLSELAPQSARMGAPKALRLSYSRGVKGPRELWASVASARAHLEVDLREVLQGDREGFATVTLSDAETQEVLGIFPITVIDEVSLKSRSRHVLRVSSQGSARLHLMADAATKLFRVRQRVLEGETVGVNLLTFNSDGIRTQQVALGDDLWVAVEKAGPQQVALIMAGGTGRETAVEIDVEPVTLDIRNHVLRASKPILQVRHDGASALYGKFELRPVGQTLARAISEPSGEVAVLEVKSEISQKGSYQAVHRASDRADVQYFYSNCVTRIEEEGRTRYQASSSYTAPDDKPRTLSFLCTPFDRGISGAHGVSHELSLVRSLGAATSKEIAFPPRASRDVEFKALAPGRYELVLSPAVAGQAVNLGVIELI